MSIAYKNRKQARNLFFLLLIIAAVLAAYKLFYSWQKIYAIQHASKLQSEGKLIESEVWFTQAVNNNTIAYRDKEAAEALKKLEPIINMKNKVQGIIDQLNQAARTKDRNGMLAAYKAYVALSGNQSGNSKQLYQDMAEYLKIGKHFEDQFGKLKRGYLKSIQDSAKDKSFGSDSTIRDMLTIPEPYLGGKLAGNAELQSVIQTYYEGELTSVLAKNDLPLIFTASKKIMKFYTEYGTSAPWIAAKIEEYMAASLKQKVENGQMEAAIADWKKYSEGMKGFISKDSRTIRYMKTAVSGQMAKANELVNGKKYMEAIALYQQVSGYQDTSGKISAAQKQMYQDNPKLLLQSAFPDVTYSAVENFFSISGYSAVSIGLNQATLYIAGLKTDGSIASASGALGQGVSVRSIQPDKELSIKKQPAFLIDAKSGTRKHHYLAYEFSGKSLKKVLDAEADSYTFEGSGKLVVTNSTGPGAGEMAYFTVQNGAYSFSKIKPDYVDISSSEIPKYIGKKVRFRTEVFATDGTSAYAALGDEFILFSSKAPMKEGSITVIGTITGTSKVKSGARSINAYQVKVSKIEK